MKPVPSPKILAIAFTLLMLGPLVPLTAATHTGEIVPDVPVLPRARPGDSCISTTVPVEILAEVNRLQGGDPSFFTSDKNVPLLCVGGAPVSEYASLIRAADRELELLRSYTRQVQRQADLRVEATLPENAGPGELVEPRSVVLSDIFDGRRTGGFGEWNVVTQKGEPAAFQRDAVRDANGTRQTYRFGSEEGYARGVHQFLVSPEIDLTTVPVDATATDKVLFARDRARDAMTYLCNAAAFGDAGSGPISFGGQGNGGGSGATTSACESAGVFGVSPLLDFPGALVNGVTGSGVVPSVGDPAQLVALAAINAAYQSAFDQTVMELPLMQHTATLELTYRANLAKELDGVRVWAYVGDKAPDRRVLFASDFAYNAVAPCATDQQQRNLPLLDEPLVGDQIDQLESGDAGEAQCTPSGTRQLIELPFTRATRAFQSTSTGYPAAITGDTSDFVSVRVNLSDLMGKRVWLLFEAKTMPNDRGADIFRDGVTFPRQDGYGFEISRVHVEASTFLRNFRVKDVGANLGFIPANNPFNDDPLAVRTVLPPGEEGVVVRLQNAGDYVENGTLTVTFTLGTTSTPISLPVVNMRPDEVREIHVPWPGAGAAEGRRYTVSATLSPERDVATPSTVGLASGLPEELPPAAEPNRTRVRPANAASTPGLNEYGSTTASATIRAVTSRNLTAVRADGLAGSPLQICKSVTAANKCTNATGNQGELAAAKKGEQAIVLVAVRNDGNTPQDAYADLAISLDGTSRPAVALDGLRRELPDLLPGEIRVLTWTLSAADPGIYNLSLALVREDNRSEPLLKRHFYVQRSTGLLCLDDLNEYRECGWAFRGGIEDALDGGNVTAATLAPDGSLLVATEIGPAEGLLMRRAPDGAWSRVAKLDRNTLSAIQSPFSAAEYGWGDFRSIVTTPSGETYLFGDNASALDVTGGSLAPLRLVDTPEIVHFTSGIAVADRVLAVGSNGTLALVGAEGMERFWINRTVHNATAGADPAYYAAPYNGTLRVVAKGAGGRLYVAGDDGFVARHSGTGNLADPAAWTDVSAVASGNAFAWPLGNRSITSILVQDGRMLLAGDGILAMNATSAGAAGVVDTWRNLTQPASGAGSFNASFAFLSHTGQAFLVGANGAVASCERCYAGEPSWQYPAIVLPTLTEPTRDAKLLAAASSATATYLLGEAGAVLGLAKGGYYDNGLDWSTVPSLAARDGGVIQTLGLASAVPMSYVGMAPAGLQNEVSAVRVYLNNSVRTVPANAPSNPARVTIITRDVPDSGLVSNLGSLGTLCRPANGLGTTIAQTCGRTPVFDITGTTQTDGWKALASGEIPINAANESFVGVELSVPAGWRWAIDDIRVVGLSGGRWVDLVAWYGISSPRNLGDWYPVDLPAVAQRQDLPEPPTPEYTPVWEQWHTAFDQETISAWHVSSALTERPVWAANNERYYAAGYAEPTAPRLMDNWDTRLVTPVIDLADATTPVVSFRHAWAFRTLFTGSGETERVQSGDGGWLEIQYELRGAECGATSELVTCGWSRFYPVRPDGGYPRRADLGLQELLFEDRPAQFNYPIPDQSRLATEGKAYWARSILPDERNEISDSRDLSKYRTETITLAKTTCTALETPATNDCVPISTFNGRKIRVAFHLETAGSVGRTTTNDPSGHNPEPVWNATRSNSAVSFPGEGWYITDFKVLGSSPLGINLRATNLTFPVGYDVATIGVGPGTRVPVNVTVENKGFFDALGYTGALVATKILPGAKATEVVARVPLSQQALLEVGESRNHTLFWNVPGGEAGENARYVLSFELTPIGIDRDEDVTDNLVRLGSVGSPIIARTVRQFYVDFAVTPENATVDITRYVPIFIVNTGNVPLDGFSVERRIQSLGRATDAVPASCAEFRDAVARGRLVSIVDCRSWNTTRVVPAGTRVALSLVSDEVNPTTDLFWKAPERANFVFRVSASTLQGQQLLTSAIDRRVSAFATYLFDDVEGGTRGEAFQGAWDFEGAWNVTEPGFRSTSAYGFGDRVLDRYGNDVDASATTPRIDLGSARTARLAFYQNYRFEQGFDAGRVEASTDGGITWTPLAAMPDLLNGLPLGFNSSVPLSPASPLHTTGNPEDVQYAITGDSSLLPAAADGWVLQQFDLTNYANVSEDDVAYERYGAAQLRAYGDQPDALAELDQLYPYGVHYADSWVVGNEDEYRYWQVDDLTENSVRPPGAPADAKMWWSGSPSLRDDGLKPAYNNMLTFSVDIGNTAPDQRIIADWWEWAERFNQAGRLIYDLKERTVPGGIDNFPENEQLLTAYTFTSGLAPANTFRFNLSKPEVVEKQGKWLHMQADVTDVVNKAKSLQQSQLKAAFLYAPVVDIDKGTIDRAYLNDRGWAIYGFELRPYTPVGGKLVKGDAPLAATQDMATCAGHQPTWPSNALKLPCFNTTGADTTPPVWAVREALSSGEGVAWSQVTQLPGLKAAWSVTPVRDQNLHTETNRLADGEAPLAWWTGELNACTPGDSTCVDYCPTEDGLPERCPVPGTDSRLVTPAFDLSRIAGDDASLSFWHRYAFKNVLPGGGAIHPLASGGVVEIQEYDPVNDRWGDWKQIYSSDNMVLPPRSAMLAPQGKVNGTILDSRYLGGYTAYTVNGTPTTSGLVRRNDAPFENVRALDANGNPVREPVQFLYSGDSSMLPNATNGWLRAEYDVSEYIGKRVRFGFHSYFNGQELTDQSGERLVNPDGDGVSKGGWWISDVALVGKVLVGQPVELRLRAATDGNVNDGRWLVDDLGVFGARYRNNVGVFVQETAGGREGTNVTLPVTVRNLGDNVRRDLGVEIRQSNRAIELNFTAPGQATRHEPGVFRIEGLTLGPGQSVTIPVNVRIPSQIGVQTKTELLVQVRERNTASATPSWGIVSDNEVQGLLQRSVVFALRRDSLAEFTALRTSPASPAVGQPVTLVATLRNAGYSPFTMEIACKASTVGENAPADHARQGLGESFTSVAEYACERTGGALTLAPGAMTNLTFVATPTRAGFLRFDLKGSVVGEGPVSATTGVVVGQSAILVDQAFGSFANLTSNWTGSLKWTTPRGRDAPGALLLGSTEEAANTPGNDYSSACGGTPCVARSKPIDLHNYSAKSPAFLSFWRMDRFAKYDGGQVRVEVLLDERQPFNSAAWSASCIIYPIGGYEGYARRILPSPGAPGQQPPDNGDPSAWFASHPDYAWRTTSGRVGDNAPDFFTSPDGAWESTWSLAVFDLSDQVCDLDDAANATNPDGTPNPNGRIPSLLGRTIRVVFETATGSPTTEPSTTLNRGQGHGWLIDDVTVGPYALSLRPQSTTQRAVLLDNTTKTFNVVLSNLGSAADRVRLELDAGNSSAPEGSILVPEAPLEIVAGETRIVPIRVTLPRDPGLLPTEFKVRLLAKSLNDRNAAGSTVLDLVFAPRRFAELQVSANAPRVALQEGIETFLPIVVENNGLVDSVPSRVLIVDEWAGGRKEQSIDLAAIPSYFERPEDATRVVEFSYRPEKGSIGPHTLTITVDPDQVGEEYTRSNNVVSLVANVTELVIPDVDIGAADALVLRNAEGGLVSGLREADVTRYEALAGEIVSFELTVSNPGRAAATNVDVRAFIGALSLPPKTIPYIAPGGEAGIAFTWLAQKGEHRVEFLVRSEQVELTTENNRNPVNGVTLLTVKGFEMDIQVPSLGRVLEPGSEIKVPFSITNAGNAGEDLELRARVPGGMRVALAREGFFLRAGETYDGIAIVTLEPEAVAGEQFITIEAVARGNPMKVATGRGVLQVNASYGGSVVGGLVAASPPTLELPIELVNEGNSLEPWTVQLRLPAGWVSKETLPAKIVVPAHDRATMLLHVTIPETTAPGDRVATIVATMPNGEKREGTLRVNVLPLHAAAVTVQDVAPKPVSGKLSVPVTVQNTGNVEAPFEVLVVSPPAGVEVRIEPATFSLAPGEKATAQMILKPNESVEAGTYAVTGYTRFEGVSPDTREGRANVQTLRLPILRQDLRVASVEFAPRADLQPGQLVSVKGAVVNRGLAALEDVAVHLYVDDVFVQEIVLPTLAPGARADAAFNWTALAGTHTLTVVVDPYKDAVEASRDDNAVSALATVAGGGAGGAVAAQRAKVPGFDVASLAFALALALALIAIPSLGSRRQRR